jgi:hypothetical protein
MDEVCMWTDDIPSMLRGEVYLPHFKEIFFSTTKEKKHRYFSISLFSKLKFLGVLQRKVA